jgi:hypothetical protein
VRPAPMKSPPLRPCIALSLSLIPRESALSLPQSPGTKGRGRSHNGVLARCHGTVWFCRSRALGDGPIGCRSVVSEQSIIRTGFVQPAPPPSHKPMNSGNIMWLCVGLDGVASRASWSFLIPYSSPHNLTRILVSVCLGAAILQKRGTQTVLSEVSESWPYK